MNEINFLVFRSKLLLYFRYSHILYRITAMEKPERFGHSDIFLEIFKLFGKAISQSSFKPLIVKGFYLLRISGDYCFRRAVQRQL